MKNTTKKLYLALSSTITLFLMNSATAAIVTIGSFDISNTTASSFTVTATAGDPTIFSFTRTANLDGGTINDTLSFDLTHTVYLGSTYDAGTGDLTLGSTTAALANLTNPHFMNNYVGDPDSNSVAAGESMTIGISNISYTSGEGFTTPVVAFNGFNSIAKFGGGSDDFYLGTTSATLVAVDGTNGAVSLGGVTDLTFSTAATATSNQRWRDLNFSFTVPDAVPEPSSTALFGLGGLALILRRRRS